MALPPLPYHHTLFIQAFLFMETSIGNAIDRPLRRTLVLLMLWASASHKVTGQVVIKALMSLPCVFLNDFMSL
jgi:hypothetical protein